MKLVLLAAMAVGCAWAQAPALETGYRFMYNLEFGKAHQFFQDWERQHPDDPLAPVSDAAASLFSEFDRMRVLESEFFTTDSGFLRRQKSLNPDPQAKNNFEVALSRGEKLADGILAQNPKDRNALFSKVLSIGLRVDYLALIEKRNLAALGEVKRGRATAEQLLAAYPDCYDAHLAIGVENYMLSLEPAPVRWVLRLSGAQTDRQQGIQKLRITAQKGRFLLPYARLLLAVAALRDKDRNTARQQLQWLATEFPNNRLYREELAKLK